MNKKKTTTEGSYGLLASGSSCRWDISIDESLERENEWSVELHSPNTYLRFQLHHLQIIPQMVEFLESGQCEEKIKERVLKKEMESSLNLGTFGQAAVSLVWDNEDFLRCFLKIEGQDNSTLHLTLPGEDIQMLVDALKQVLEDLEDLLHSSALENRQVSAK